MSEPEKGYRLGLARRRLAAGSLALIYWQGGGVPA
jgi:hypothetical protein